MKKTPSKKPVVGITLGDPAGIGPEVVARSLEKSAIRQLANFKIIGHRDLLNRYLKRSFRNISFLDNFSQDLSSPVIPGKPNRETADASLEYLQKAVDLLKAGTITSLATAPVSKEAISSLGQRFHGHTEFLANAFHVRKYEMLFVSDQLKTLVVTRHIPLSQVSRMITIQNVYTAIELSHCFLTKHYMITKPRIAVCGLNPHAGEGGTVGEEEIRTIIPAIKKAQKKGIHAEGPFAADTIFTPSIAKDYDIVIAMYHDQGTIPVKTLSFHSLVNITIGLPFIRTSPAHGTAYGIAGKRTANPDSMAEAIKLAAMLSVK